jgi:hypothetical protein
MSCAAALEKLISLYQKTDDFETHQTADFATLSSPSPDGSL